MEVRDRDRDRKKTASIVNQLAKTMYIADIILWIAAIILIKVVTKVMGCNFSQETRVMYLLIVIVLYIVFMLALLCQTAMIYAFKRIGGDMK